MKRLLSLLLAALLPLGLMSACGAPADGGTQNGASTLVSGSADYTRINPAMDEHGEINVLLFDGLAAHDGENQIIPGLAETWEYNPETCTYTFHLRPNVKWHDGQPFTAEDVKFTIESIMDPENGSENAPNYEDVEEITVIDEHTVVFRLSEPNVAFQEYMTIAILPKHLLEGEDMQASDFFRAPVGTDSPSCWSKTRTTTAAAPRLTGSSSKSWPMTTLRPSSWNPASWIWPCWTPKTRRTSPQGMDSPVMI